MCNSRVLNEDHRAFRRSFLHCVLVKSRWNQRCNQLQTKQFIAFSLIIRTAGVGAGELRIVVVVDAEGLLRGLVSPEKVKIWRNSIGHCGRHDDPEKQKLCLSW